MEPGAKLIEFKKIKVVDHIKEIMGDNEVCYLKWIRLATNIPIGIEQQSYIGEQLSTYDWKEITLYDVIPNELGIPFSEVNQKINCGPIPKKDLEYLQVDETVCILKAERIIKGQDRSSNMRKFIILVIDIISNEKVWVVVSFNLHVGNEKEVVTWRKIEISNTLYHETLYNLEMYGDKSKTFF